MARSKCCVMLVLAVAVLTATARDVPSDKGLKDQKNFLSYGGVGGFSGIGNNGIPFAGLGSGVGGAGSLFPGGGGSIGTVSSFPLGGIGSTGGVAGLGGLGGGAGLGGLGGGAGLGGGGGGGAGTLPLP